MSAGSETVKGKTDHVPNAEQLLLQLLMLCFVNHIVYVRVPLLYGDS